MAKATNTKDVVETKEKTNLPTVIDFSADAGAGLQNLTAADYAVPFISILQSLSPEVKKGPHRIEDAEEGDIINTVTKEVVPGDDGIIVIPCAYQKRWLEWVDRQEGGGLVKIHETEDIMQQTTPNERGKDALSNGHIVVPTAQFFCLVINGNGDVTKAIIAFTSTQLKKARKWNSIMAQLKLTNKDGLKYTPPMFSHIYKLSTVQETKDTFSWYGWDIKQMGQVTEQVWYMEARDFNKEILKGNVKVKMDAESEVM